MEGADFNADAPNCTIGFKIVPQFSLHSPFYLLHSGKFE